MASYRKDQIDLILTAFPGLTQANLINCTIYLATL